MHCNDDDNDDYNEDTANSLQFCLNAADNDRMVMTMIKSRRNTKSVGKKCKLIFQVLYIAFAT